MTTKGYHYTEEQRKNISKGLKGKMIGDKNSSKRPEVIEKIKQKAIERYQNKDFCEKHQKSCKDYYKTHEHHTKGKEKTEEQKKKMSIARKQWYLNNPEKSILKSEKSRLTNIKKGTHKNERNPNWHDGISKKPKKYNYIPNLKIEIKKRDGFSCRQCFRHKSELKYPLVIHHIDFNKINDNPNNLITLCKGCHSQLSFNREDWIKNFKNVMIERRLK